MQVLGPQASSTENRMRLANNTLTSTLETREIPISLISEQKLRIDTSRGLEELMESLLLHGQLAPIMVRPSEENLGEFTIVFGNRRFTAAKELGWKSIKAQIINISRSEALVLAFTENSDRDDFSDYEKALLLQRIHDTTGKKYNEIAKIIGRSAAFVAQHIAMLHLFADELGSPDEKQHVLSSLTEGHARVLANLEDQIDRWNTAKLAVASHMGVRELARICSRRRLNSNVKRENKAKTVVELIKDILRGTASKDIRPFSNSLCPRHFTMFTSFRTAQRLTFEGALDHVSQSVRKIDDWDQQIEDLVIRRMGAVSYATLTIKHHIKSSNKTYQARTRATLIFEKEDGYWKCAHGHWSSVDATEQIPLHSILNHMPAGR